MNFEAMIAGLIGVMFLSVIGVYIWTFKIYSDSKKSLGNIYSTVNAHFQDVDIHGRRAEYVLGEVCTVMHSELKEDVIEIKADVKELLRRDEHVNQ